MYDGGHDTQQKSHSPQPLWHSPRLQDKLREVSYILHILAHNNIDIFFYDYLMHFLFIFVTCSPYSHYIYIDFDIY